jgi:O-antigen ligase
MHAGNYCLARLEEATCSSVRTAGYPFVILFRWTPLLFCLTLVVFLFRPPDVQLYELDRIAFAVLVVVVLWRALLLRKRLRPASSLLWPMAALAALASVQALAQPFDAQTWSLLAAKFIVPFTMFYLVGLVFDDGEATRPLGYCLLGILGYLAYLAVIQLAGLDVLVFPRYILNPDVGLHADRARGPFLQAVPNGVAITVLGLIVLSLLERRALSRPLGWLLLLPLPFAILATKTRAVWISFAGALVWIAWRKRGSVRRIVLSVAAVAAVGVAALVLAPDLTASFQDRAEESGPIEVRLALYEASWGMIREKPFLGWGPNQMPREIVARMERYRIDVYTVHNTLLETLLELGVVGLVLQAVIFVGLFRLGRGPGEDDDTRGSPLVASLRNVWPLIAAVYLFNSFFVVMNYQFVNALIFTLAGILVTEKGRARDAVPLQHGY